jgi:tetratricopeptide (TPR) repeat protein
LFRAKLALLILLLPLSAAQHPAPRRTAPSASAPLQPVAPWTLPLFTSDPAQVLSAAAFYTAPENADAAVLSYFISVQIDAAGKMTQTTRMVTRVLRLQGAAAVRQVNIGWLPSREERPKIKARVITSDGKAHLLQDAAVKDVSPRAGPDAAFQPHVLSAALPAVDFDSIIELESIETDPAPIYPGGRWGEIWLDARNPIFQFSADIASDSPHALRVEARSFAQPEVRETSLKGHVTINASRIPPPAFPILLPPDISPSPQITFSDADSWQALAQWCASHPEALTKLFDESARKAIAKLTSYGPGAKLALIRQAPAVELLPNQPGLEGFTRVLIFVPGAQPKWIDPLAEDKPLPLTDQGRFALILDPSTTDLLRTPESTAQDNRALETIDIQLKDGEPAAVNTTIDAHGVFAEMERPKAQQTAGYPASAVGDAGGFIDLPGPASVQFRSLGPLLDPRAPDQPDRTFDYYAYPPFSEMSRFHVTLPPGFHFGELPQLTDIAIGPLTLSPSVKLQTDGSLVMAYALTSPKTRYSPQEGAAIRRDAAQKLAGKAAYRIVFVNTGEELIANGKPKEALDVLSKYADAGTSATLRVADAYVANGARTEAVKICEQVIAKDPKNAAAYLRLGWVWAHNESGQLYGEGMNTAEAEKADRKAIELKPDERAWLLQLATLYTYNCCGVRYGNGARLDDAIAAYTKAGMTALTATRSLNELAATLLFAGKYDQLRQFFLYPEAESADQAIRIAGIAASSGANDAREDLSSEQHKSEILEHAVRYLALARDYPAAVALGASDPRLRRTKKFDETALSSDPAIAAFQRFVEAELNPSKPGPLPDDRSRLFKLFNPSAKSTPDSIEWPSIADILATALDLKSQQSGDAFTIFAASKAIAHVVKRGDEYVVADLVP